MNPSLREQFEDAAMHVPQLGDIDDAITTGVQRRNRARTVAAVAGMTCVAILAAVIWSTGPGNSQPEPLDSPTPLPSTATYVGGWPDGGRNLPGEYSLNRFGCNGSDVLSESSCIVAWMHNGYGSGDVELMIRVKSATDADQVDPSSGTTVGGIGMVVAGHDTLYQSIDERHERWTILDLEDRLIIIDVTAKPGTSAADMADVHAIIDSMRTEPSHSELGLRLVFTLTNRQWDSG